MISHTEARFWKFYGKLQPEIQEHADRAYELWKSNPFHPSLQFKRVDPNEPLYSVRVGRAYRALGWREKDTITWFWIGNHDDYNRLLRS